ncbi:MAG: hypothetical protein C4582_00185 [Desulfobacteraceae bacterium]|nr:MAG: hypothetical protein C4582_00185 [Desulfobacteraceae bacterium]
MTHSYRPASNNAYDALWLKLKNNLETPATGCFSNQLITIFVSLVSTDLELRKKALDGLVERDAMNRELIPLKVVFEV